MRVLIVGCGYVGLPLGLELIRQGHTVFALRRGREAADDLAKAGLQPLTGDITRREDLAKLPASYDWVVNCVASSGGGPEEYRRLYVEGTRNLIEWLRPTPPAKFVYTGSTSVYGQADDSVVTEQSLTEPAEETAKALLETENLLLTAASQEKFPAIVLRVAGVYGPGRGYWFRQFVEGKARIEGDGHRILNMIHRDDVVGCVIAALRNGRAGQIYNAVDDEPVSQKELFTWLGHTLGRAMPAAGEPGPRKRGMTSKCVSNQKLKRELGYNFRYPTFREGFATLRISNA